MALVRPPAIYDRFPLRPNSRFFGIIHSHVCGGGWQASRRAFACVLAERCRVVSIDPVDVIAGGLPTRLRRLVEAWAELHQAELLDDWNRLQAGRAPVPIEPLA